MSRWAFLWFVLAGPRKVIVMVYIALITASEGVDSWGPLADKLPTLPLVWWIAVGTISLVILVFEGAYRWGTETEASGQKKLTDLQNDVDDLSGQMTYLKSAVEARNTNATGLARLASEGRDMRSRCPVDDDHAMWAQVIEWRDRVRDFLAANINEMEAIVFMMDDGLKTRRYEINGTSIPEDHLCKVELDKRLERLMNFVSRATYKR